ncbi:MAG: alkaline phytoceramidase [Gammaproteobacteria bacterium]|nr:MAG: alkaline phytoceramidase [Gammaproteobacteria bacterium]
MVTESPGRVLIILAVAAIAVAGVMLLVEPVPQWPGYHDFADARGLAGIPHAANVLSNVVFLVVGVWGLVFVLTREGRRATGALLPNYLAFFAGVALTALGSGYYHWAPDNVTLVWDRLPMSIGFMALLSIIGGELISVRAARILLMPLLALGAASVAWWALTEQAGAGDLRPYALVQFLSPVLILLMVFMYDRSRDLFLALVAMGTLYALAKIFEFYDPEILRVFGLASGHTLKHLFAGTATAGMLVLLYRRE